MRTFSCLIPLLLFISLGAAGHAQGTRIPKAAEIAAKVEQAYEGINDYTVTLDVIADLERLSVQPMHATMYFKKPDKVHYESKGFFLLPREGMVYNPAVIRSRYTIEEPAVKDTLNGQNVYRITLSPKGERRRAMKLFALVDPARWTVQRVFSESAEGPQLSGEFRYVHVDRWWLPAELTVRFAVAGGDTARNEMPEQAAPMARPQMPRAGSVTVRYSDYQVNTGLKDELFTQPEGKE